MKNQAPNSVEEDWREAVRALGPPFCHIHHCVGRTARHNKVYIGHWFILPVTKEGHAAIHAAGKDRKPREKALFEELLYAYKARHGRKAPIPADVLKAIRGWHR